MLKISFSTRFLENLIIIKNNKVENNSITKLKLMVYI